MIYKAPKSQKESGSIKAHNGRDLAECLTFTVCDIK